MSEYDGIEEPPKVWPYHIRKLRSLTPVDKCFLFTVLSHKNGFMYRSAKNAASDMGISLGLFYRTRTRLLKAELIWETQSPGHTTLYQVNPWVIHASQEQEQEQDDSPTPSTDDSPTPSQNDKGGLFNLTEGSSQDDRGSSQDDKGGLVNPTRQSSNRRSNKQIPREETTRRARAREEPNPKTRSNAREGGRCIAHGIKDDEPEDPDAGRTGLYEEGWCGHLLDNAIYRIDTRDPDVEFHLLDRSRAAFLGVLKELELELVAV